MKHGRMQTGVNVRLLGLVMMSLIQGCASPTGDFCDVARDIKLTKQDMDIAVTMSRPAKEGIVYHREVWREKCLGN